MMNEKLSAFPSDSIFLNSKRIFLGCPSLVYFCVNSTSKVYSRINYQLGIDAILLPNVLSLFVYELFSNGAAKKVFLMNELTFCVKLLQPISGWKP